MKSSQDGNIFLSTANFEKHLDKFRRKCYTIAYAEILANMKNAKSISALVIPEGTVGIADYAPENCKPNDGNVILPESLKYIGIRSMAGFGKSVV